MTTAQTQTQTANVGPSARDQAVSASRATRDRMLKAMHVLEAAAARGATAREPTWRKRIVTALAALEQDMLRQAAELNGEEGLLAELVRADPRLEPRIKQLRRQYGDLVRQIASLREQFSTESDANQMDVADVRQRLAWLLAALRHFQSRESDLIYEAIHVDIGAVD